jgi:hypothetical protein
MNRRTPSRNCRGRRVSARFHQRRTGGQGLQGLCAVRHNRQLAPGSLKLASSISDFCFLVRENNATTQRREINSADNMTPGTGMRADGYIRRLVELGLKAKALK